MTQANYNQRNHSPLKFSFYYYNYFSLEICTLLIRQAAASEGHICQLSCKLKIMTYPPLLSITTADLSVQFDVSRWLLRHNVLCTWGKQKQVKRC